MEKKLRLMKITGIVIFNLICLFSVIYVVATTVEKKQAIGEEAGVRVIKEFQGPKKEIKPAEVKPAEAKPVEPKSPEATMSSQSAQSAAGARFIEPASGPDKSDPYRIATKVLLVDDFTGEDIRNKIGSRANVYSKAPSRIMIARRDDVINGNNKKVLMVKYDKKNSGGPNGMGGWCGYYTLIKNEKAGEYLDGSEYKYLTFWVKGEKGDENFMAGIADEHWDKIGDSLKTEEIGVYLEKKKITTEWQKAKVPLDVFFLDHANLSAISINFEADCFPEGAGAGVVYIADIALEK